MAVPAPRSAPAGPALSRPRPALTKPDGPSPGGGAAPRWVTTAARVGHVGTGTVHGLVGTLAILAAVDPEARVAGFRGALHHLASHPLGTLLLAGLGAGLIVDALWQAVRTTTNADGAGASLWGSLERAGWLGSGLLHLGLGMAAVRLLRETPAAAPASSTRAWTAAAMALPMGRALVALAALTVIAVSGVMIVRAARSALDPWLDVDRMPAAIRSFARVVLSVGLATRAAVYSMIAAFLLLAAVQADPQVVRGVGGTLRLIRLGHYGSLALTAIGLGFIANGAMELIRARYRPTPP